MLSLEGNTGPYLQYTHTRAASILAKAGRWRESYRIKKLIAEEKRLLKLLEKFPLLVKSAAEDMRPYYLCNYAYELAVAFNRFYQKCPVLKAKDKREFRLTLVKKTKEVLSTTLKLIGIEPLEKM
jgi:arginyl-tRNA synthetase